MFSKKNTEKEIDIKKLNDVIGLSKKILKITYFLIFIVGVYAITMLIKEWNIMIFLKTLLTIVSPLFIGIVIAWLFDPFVRWLKRKGVRRVFGATLAYILFVGGIFIVVSSIVPLLSEQINEFANSIPSIFDSIKNWIDGAFDKLGNIRNFDAASVKVELFNKIEEVGMGLTQSLPETMVTFLKSFFSGMGIFVVGLIIGFYLLISFDNVNETIITFLPKRFRTDARDLINEVNTSLRKFVQGTLLSATLVFITTSLGLSLSGIKAPLLFGLFCGLTNVIPYIGPYIGGLPAIIVGFSQDVTIGIFVLVVIIIIQFLEGNFFQPIIMSKTMKLHPVTIMLSLLIFGYYWGIIGMILATPVVAALKSIIMFFDDKYHILNFND